MPDNQTITHVTQNDRYSMSFERAPSATKGTPGFKVTAKADDMGQLLKDIAALKAEAEHMAGV